MIDQDLLAIEPSFTQTSSKIFFHPLPFVVASHSHQLLVKALRIVALQHIVVSLGISPFSRLLIDSLIKAKPNSEGRFAEHAFTMRFMQMLRLFQAVS